MKMQLEKYLTKSAFTMLELVFVIVVMGILARIMVPNTRTNPLQEAAIQVASHIKYTQHLAMMDDKYSTSRIDKNKKPIWFKDRWQLVFSSNVFTGGSKVVAYTIFSDTLGNAVSRGDANEKEVAKNPKNRDQIMTGGYSKTAALNYTDAGFIGMKKLNLGMSYNISSVDFSNSCDGSANNATRLGFDHLGRPIQGDMSTMTAPYTARTNRLITSNCDITLSDGTDNITIRVTPETGFVCVIDRLGNCI